VSIASAKENIMLPVSHIVLATDLSNCSKFAFQLARTIARDFGAKLTIVHVTPPPVLMDGEGLVPAIMPPAVDYLRGEMEKLLADAALPSAKYLLLDGDPASEILRVAADNKADLIVLGTHGRTGLGRMLMGSVAEQVLRRATCPVLSVKTPLPELSKKSKGRTTISVV